MRHFDTKKVFLELTRFCQLKLRLATAGAIFAYTRVIVAIIGVGDLIDCKLQAADFAGNTILFRVVVERLTAAPPVERRRRLADGGRTERYASAELAERRLRQLAELRRLLWRGGCSRADDARAVGDDLVAKVWRRLVFLSQKCLNANCILQTKKSTILRVCSSRRVCGCKGNVYAARKWRLREQKRAKRLHTRKIGAQRASERRSQLRRNFASCSEYHDDTK